jgi:hypothetical protein
MGRALEIPSMPDRAMLVVYAEVNKGEKLQVTLRREGGSRVATGGGRDENDPENFMKVRGLRHKEFVQLREQMVPGETYYMQIRGTRDSWGRNIGRCSLARVAITIVP